MKLRLKIYWILWELTHKILPCIDGSKYRVSHQFENLVPEANSAEFPL
jgi:hypothetical protein